MPLSLLSVARDLGKMDSRMTKKSELHGRRICVFAGARSGIRPRYAAAARELGQRLAEDGVGVVFGGGRTGLMAEVASAALDSGGEVIGIIPEALLDREGLHAGIRDMRVVSSMHERKAMMAALSDGFVALPGGLGTLEEFLEVATWTQLGVHRKPCVLLNVAGYFSSLVQVMDKAVLEGFLSTGERKIVVLADTVADVLREVGRSPEWRSSKDIELDKT